jgi:hypothetical protein
MPENGDFHNAIPPESGQPQPLGERPIGFRKIGSLVPLAFFDDQHFVAFFRKPQGADRAAEAAAYDDVVVLHVFQFYLKLAIKLYNNLNYTQI